MNKPLLCLLLTLFAAPLHAQTFDVLVWADEFSVDGPLDTAKWWQQHQLPNGTSWYNGEIQHYTNRDTNAFVQGGSLHLAAYKETYTNQGQTKEYTSARLNSKFAFTYGRVEIRAQLPTGVGTWPALWMLGQNITEPGAYWQTQGFGTQPWPQCGEIDIMEHWGHNQNYVSSAIHTPSSFGGTQNVGGQYVSGASTGYHTYSMEWTPTSITFAVDSVTHYTYAPTVKNSSTWPFDLPQFILMNIAIQPSIDPNFTTSEMLVDYVRIYQSSLSVAEPIQPSVRISPNPSDGTITIAYPAGTTSARLLSTQGQVLRALNVDQPQVDLSAFAAGTYVLEVVIDGCPEYARVLKR
jgi:beta-glucanase (GH16 family)